MQCGGRVLCVLSGPGGCVCVCATRLVPGWLRGKWRIGAAAGLRTGEHLLLHDSCVAPFDWV
jgi:hypothetical protein